MATYRLCVVCALLCIAYAVVSVKISVNIKKYADNTTSDVEVSENINGENWIKGWIITLDRLVEESYLPTLTLTDIKANTLVVKNISLENVPVFENVSVNYVAILGNKIKYVPTNAFNVNGMQSLILDNNEIQYMSVKSIYADIKHLFLRCNKLTEFSQDWLRNPSRITTMYLSYNRIETIPDHAFNRMPRLISLYLNNNCIKRIGSEAFSAGITQLHLQFNSIEELIVDMFVSGTRMARQFYIHHNQLNYLPAALWLKLKPVEISLDGNPWQCQCLRDIERWIREQNSTRRYLRARRGEPVCVVPLSFQNLCVPGVDKELQQMYARELSPVQECSGPPCKPCPYFELE